MKIDIVGNQCLKTSMKIDIVGNQCLKTSMKIDIVGNQCLKTPMFAQIYWKNEEDEPTKRYLFPNFEK